MGCNSACVGNITEMLTPSRGFSRSCYCAIEWCQRNSTTSDPVAMATKFQTKRL